MARISQLAVIGTVAGVFSGLFGVGGGVLLVPLLIAWLGYGEREATGTSLTAIAVIASAGALMHTATYGNLNVRDALLIGFPAVGGVVIGADLQQKLPTIWISRIFACVLVATAIALVV